MARRPARRTPPAPFRPQFEALEARDVPATVTWDAAAHPTGGDYSVGANWKGGTAPVAGDDAVINLTAAGTVGYNSAATVTVGSLTTSSFTTFNVNKGTVTIAASVATGTLAGPVNVAAGATLAANAGAKVALAAGEVVTVGGTLSLNAPALFNANRTTFPNAGVTVAVASGGLVTATGANLTVTGSPGAPALIAVGSGGGFKSVNSTVGWDSVTLDAASVLAAGDVTGTGFAAALTTPVKFVPVFVGNASFKDVVLTGATVQSSLNLAPLGVDATQQRYVFPAGTLTVSSGTALNFTAGAKLVFAAGSAVAVNGGTLSVDSPASVVANRTTFPNAGVTVTVGSGGLFKSKNATFGVAGSPGQPAQLLVGSGGSFQSVGSTFGWDDVTLDPTSFLSAGDVKTSAFDAPLTLPAKYVPVFVGNARFLDVRLTVGTNDPALTLSPLGLDASNQRYVFPAGTFVVAGGTSLAFAAGSKIAFAAGAAVDVSGTLTIDAPTGVNAGRTTFPNAGVTVTVNAGGLLSLKDATLTATGSPGAPALIAVGAGGGFKSKNTVIGWDQVSLSATSVVAVGDIVTTAIDAALTTPLKFVPALVGNARFKDVTLTGTTVLPSLDLAPLGLDASQQRYVVAGGTLTVAAGTALNVRPGANVTFGQAGIATVAVNGTLTIDTPASLVGARGNFPTVGVTIAVNSGGVLRSTNGVYTVAGAGSTALVQVSSGGTFTGTGNSFGWDVMTLAGGSTAKLQYNFFATKLNVSSGTNVALNAIRNNDFTGVAVVASGAAGATIDLTNNYWGSSVTAVIGGHITDKVYPTPAGNPALPTVNFTPVLAGKPVQALPVAPAAITYSLADQPVPLSASIRAPSSGGLVNVNSGTVRFTVQVGGTTVGVPITMAVSSGVAAGTYTFPGGTDSGAYTILAEYRDAGGTLISSDNSQALTVNPVATVTTAADATRTFTVAAGTVTLTATVTSPAGTVNVGAVVFRLFSGGTPVGTATSANVSGGTATASYALPVSLAGGPYTVQAAYGGTTNLAASGSAPKTLTVSPAATATATANRAAAFSGLDQTVALTATVTSPAGSVSGGVVTFTLRSGATVVGTVVSGGVAGGSAAANYTLPAGTPAGVLAIDAAYGGSGNYLNSGDSAKALTVTQAATATAPPAATPPGYGLADQTFVVSATVSSPGGAVGAGTVTFSLLDALLAVVGTPQAFAVNGSGVASGNYVLPGGTPAGTYTVRAAYGGSANFTVSAAATTAVTVAKAAAAAAAASATATYAAAGQSVTLSASVTSGVGVVSQGAVTFTLVRGGVTFGSPVTVAVTSGVAAGAYALPAGLAAGTYAIAAAYDGLTNFVSVTDSTHAVVVSAAASVSLAASAAASYAVAGQGVTLSATVVSGAGVVAEGTAVFSLLSGALAVGAPVSTAVAAGAASVAYPLPAGTPAGAYTLRVTYVSAGNFLTSTNDSTLTVRAVASSVVAVAAAAAYTVAAQSVALSAAVTSAAGVVGQGTVVFTVFSGAVAVGTPTAGAVVAGVAAASYALPAGTAAGAYRVEAAYASAGDLTASADPAGGLTIAAAATATASAGPSVTFSVAGQAVTLTATVSSPAGTLNAGTVTFRLLDGVTVVGSPATVTVTGGTAAASYTLPAGLVPGAYAVEATFGGGTNFAPSAGTLGRLTVAAPATATAAVSVATTYSVAGQSVALAATVTSTAAVNAGSVTFTLLRAGAVVGGPVTVPVAAGRADASYALPAGSPAGTYAVRAAYGGAALLAASEDASHALAVAPAASAVAPADATATFAPGGQSVTLTASATSPAGPVGVGTVTFTLLLGATPVGTPVAVAVVAGSASAGYALPAGTPAGDYVVVVAYSGTGDLLPAGPATARLTVGRAAQTVTFAALPPVTYGTGPLTLTATAGLGQAVAFRLVSGPATLSGAMLTVTGAGDIVVAAGQPGSNDYLPAAEAQQRLAVRTAPLTLTANDATGTAGRPLPALGYRVTGLVNGDADGVVTGAAVATAALGSSPAGSYPVVVSGGAAANYVISRLPGTLVLAAPVVVPTVPPPVAPGVVQSLQGATQFAVSADIGGSQQVKIYSRDGTPRATIQAFDAATPGGVRVASADFTGAGQVDVVAGTGPGTSNRVRLLDGATGRVKADFQPFEATFTGGLFVALGDVNGDGVPDLVVTPDQSGGPVVAVYDGAALARGQVAQLDRFFGIEDPDFRGGARAAVALVGGRPLVVVSAGFGGGPRIAVFDGRDVAAGSPRPGHAVPDFFAFEPGLRNGAYVAAGDVTGSGSTALIFGAGPGGGPRVRVFDSARLLAAAGTYGNLDEVPAAQVANFFAGDPANTGGVRVAVKRLDATNQASLVVGAGGAGVGAPPRVAAYTGPSLLASPTPTALYNIDDFPDYVGGVFVG